MIALGALPLFAWRGHAKAQDYPPVFRTARYQFTIIAPQLQLLSITLTDLNGHPAQIAPPAGKILLVNIWATWCDACQLDLPLLERFYGSDEGSVAVAAVSTDTVDRQKIQDFLRRLGIRRLPIYLDPNGRLVNNSTQQPAPLSLVALPVTYLITPSGTVAGYIQGVVDWSADDARRLLDYYASA
jgi:thiol-disulfide isomerase/thioredoxin